MARRFLLPALIALATTYAQVAIAVPERAESASGSVGPRAPVATDDARDVTGESSGRGAELLSSLTAFALPQSSRTLLPGEGPEVVFRFGIRNEGPEPETLATVTLANATTGTAGASQSDLDREWQPLRLEGLRAGDLVGRAPEGVFAAGSSTFLVDEVIAPGDSAMFSVQGGPSLLARDGDVLDIVITDATAFEFTRGVSISGPFPLDPPGGFLVDGMSAAQITFGGLDPSLLTGTVQNVALDFTLRGNGYEDDTLTRLDVLNLGDALPGDDIARIELWAETGDTWFDPNLDLPLGEMLHTGDRWERTGLSWPVPVGGGQRFWVTVDVEDLATAGRTVQLTLAGAPDPGVGMASDNDGPIDGPAGSSPQTISTINRVTISPVAIASGNAFPGEVDRILLALAAENHYTVDKTLTALGVENRGTGTGSRSELDAAFSQLTIWADDGDEKFEGAPSDTALATSFFEFAEALFAGLSWALESGSTRHLFVTGTISTSFAADGDTLAAHVAAAGALTFSDPTSLAASWPLDSDARHPVDGMVSEQITSFGAPAATVGPNEGPVLALDVLIPSNGYRPDELSQLSVVNEGSATGTDLAEVRFWRDGGDGAFGAGAGDDLDLGPLAFFGDEWSNPTLAVPLPVGGARFFVSVVSSGSPADSASVRFAIPVDGIEVVSGNDGPIDAAVENPEAILLSTAVLLASLEILPAVTTIDSTVTVTMDVRNMHPSATIDSVAPSPLGESPGAELTLTLESGPTPAMHTLAPFEEQSFSWTYRATAVGETRLSGSASGREQGGGQPHQSLEVLSNSVRVFVAAQNLDLYAVESMPFSINRGQQGVVPLTLTFENPGGPSGTDIELNGLRIRLEDEQGGGVVPADLLSRVVVSEGAVVYLDKTSLETSGSEVDLTLATPVLIESDGSSSQATVGIVLDISDSTTVPNFLVEIVDATWLEAEDATTGGPVTVNLQDPPSFPIASGLARIAAEATQLDVAGVSAPDRAVGQGQTAIAVLDATLDNPDRSGLAADIRVTGFDVTLIDSAGVPIATPAGFLDRIRVRTPSQVHLDRALGGGDDTKITLALSTLISVPVNTPIPITIEADMASGSMLGAFRVQLGDSADFDARDANTGTPVRALYTPDPLGGPLITVQAPADSVVAAGLAQIPSQVPVGSIDVPAITVVLDHPGGAEIGPVRVESLTLACRDDANAPLVPASYLERVRVLRGGAQIGLDPSPPSAGGELTVALTGVLIAPGGRESLEVCFDAEVTAPATLFSMSVGASGVTAVDANLDLPVTVVAANGTEFPLSSGLAQFTSPARTLAVGFRDSMPATLAADGGSVIAATLVLRNAAEETAGPILIAGLRVRAADRHGVPIDIGAAVQQVTARIADEAWATSGALEATDQEALLAAADTLELAPDSPVEVEIAITLQSTAPAGGLRLGFVAEDMGVVQPDSPLLSVSVLPEDGESFPFWTSSGTLSGTMLTDSYTNFPNPFAAGRQETTIAFYLPQPGRVSLRLFTMRGEVVRTVLDSEPLGAGMHQGATWDGRNGRGNVVMNGTYLAEIEVVYEAGGSDRLLRKVAVVR